MTVNERIDDIKKRTGLSEDIIRSVLKAETDSMVDSLKKGEKVTLIGRCTCTPYKRGVLKVGCEMGTRLGVSIKPSPKVQSILRELEDFEDSEASRQMRELEEKESDLLLAQITELI